MKKNIVYVLLHTGYTRTFTTGDEAKDRSLVVRFQKKEVSPDKALTLTLADGTKERISVAAIKHMTIIEKGRDDDKELWRKLFGDSAYDDFFGEGGLGV